jgi:hypothetical protein
MSATAAIALLAALQAVVTGVSPDGAYLNRGSLDGVRVGDAVTVAGQTLTIAEVGPHRARTSPIADALALAHSLRAGTHAEIGASGVAPAPASAAPATPRPVAPQVDPAQAPVLWAAAEDGWQAPLPFAGAATTATAAAPASLWRIRGDLSLTTFHSAALDGSRATSVGTLGSRLAVEREALRYEHDVRFNGGLPFEVVRDTHPLVEARQLELGYSTSGFGARGGRLRTDDRLSSGPVDGAALRLSAPGERLDYGGELYGGLVPAPDTLAPDTARRTAGLGGRLGLRRGGWAFETTAGANAIAGDGGLERVVVGPSLDLHDDTWAFSVFTDVDLQPTLVFSQVHASAFWTWSAHGDVGLRYGRFEAPLFGHAAAGAAHDVWLDARFDLGAPGTLWPRLGLLVDPEGESLVPGLDYRVALTRALDARLGYDYTRGPQQESHQGRGTLTWRIDGAVLAELDAGARGTLIYPAAGPAEDLEKTAELGAWLALPGDLDLHLHAEGTLAWQDRLVALADLRWRFGP